MRSIETRTCCGTWPVRAVENNAIRILICEFTRIRVMHHPFETDVRETFKRVPSRISSLPRRRTVSPSLSGPTNSPRSRSAAPSTKLATRPVVVRPGRACRLARGSPCGLDFRYGASWEPFCTWMRSRQATDVVRVFCLHGSTPCLAHLGSHLGSPDHHSPLYLICAVRKRLSFAGYSLSTVPETEKASTCKPMNSRTARSRSER